MAGMSHENVEAWFETHFPDFGSRLALESVATGQASMRLRVGGGQLRPGGVVSGPNMMLLADATVYAALLATDEDARSAVTTSFNIVFLRPAAPKDVLADAELLSAGRRLVVAEVRLRSAGEEGLVAQATVTYVRQ